MDGERVTFLKQIKNLELIDYVSNNFNGNNAGGSITTGNGENVCVGNNAAANMTTGQQNILIGDNCAAGANVTGSSNVIIGDNAGYDLTTGSNNTCLLYTSPSPRDS